jgi:hypothetical protein
MGLHSGERVPPARYATPSPGRTAAAIFPLATGRAKVIDALRVRSEGT